MVIPYLPNPQPDEILGSWLARIRMHNGEGLWQSLLGAAGYKFFHTSLFRIPVYDPKMERLLALLGMSFKTALLQHTHLPYVMAFQDVHHPGLGDEPLEKGAADPNVLHSDYLADIERALRFCPECIAEAFDVDEPIWRLSHQLPNVAYCSVHETSLLDGCPACATPVALAPDRLVRALPLRCTCGHSLTERLIKSADEPWLHRSIRLLSMEASSQTRGKWSGRQIRAHLQTLLRNTEVRRYIDFFDRDDEDYPMRIIDSTIQLTHEPTKLKIFVKKRLANAKAPDLCCLMALLRRSFENDASTIAAVTVPPKLNYALGLTRETMQKRLHNFVEKWRSKKTVAHPKVCSAYWYFRLEEPNYLERYPDVKIVSVPAIGEDRTMLIRKLQSCRGRTAKDFVRSVHASKARFMRMTIRDGEWLKKVRERFVVDEPKLNEATLADRQDRIRVVVERLMRSDSRPLRLTAAVMASHTKLTRTRLRAAIQADPQLRATIEDWNAQFPERVCRWAIVSLHKEGKEMHVLRVIRTAGISALHKHVAARLLREYATLHGLVLVNYSAQRIRDNCKPQSSA